MKVNIIRSIDYNQQKLDQISALLIKHNAELQFNFPQYVSLRKAECWRWDDLFAEIAESREKMGIDADEFVILLTSTPNESNWFSAYDSDGNRNIFIHTDDFRNYIDSDDKYPVVYEMIANVLQYFMYGTIEQAEKEAHNEPLGCINDMCGWKADIGIKLRTADICTDCLRKISSIGSISNSALRQITDIMEEARRGVLCVRDVMNEVRHEVSMPFTIAVAKRKMLSVSEPFRKFLLLIDYFDSLIRTTVICLSKLAYDKNQHLEFMQVQGLSSRPSLGNWVAALSKVLKDGNSILDATTYPRIQRDIQEIVRITNEANIVSLRNEHRGHGYISCQDGSYREYYITYSKLVNQIEDMVKPLYTMYELWYIVHSSKIADQTFAYRYHKLSSDNSLFMDEEYKHDVANVQDIAITGHIYLTDRMRQKWIDLDPLMLYHECSSCRTPRVFIADGDVYIDPYQGERLGKDHFNK